MRETKRSEKPWFDVTHVRPPSVLRSTPAPSVPSISDPPGWASTELTVTDFAVACRHVAVPSSETHSPSVVPAKKTSWLSGSCANERVRRLEAGMPRMRVHRAAPSAER